MTNIKIRNNYVYVYILIYLQTTYGNVMYYISYELKYNYYINKSQNLHV